MEELNLLDAIKRLSAAGYTPEQTAFRLGLDKDDFNRRLSVGEDDWSVAYFTGFNSIELVIRESVFNLAASGSSPAQTLAVKILEDTRKTLRKDGIGENEI